LDKRVASRVIKELILATSATVDGESTAYFIARRYSTSDVKVSRIARGVPEGGALDIWMNIPWRRRWISE